jgi:[ribosomal protein S5]-alanine N-acetyltransferase
MYAITLTPPTPQDASALLAFEVANRAWFESWVAARPPAYYSLEGVQAAIDQAMHEAEQDRTFQFLIKSDDQILGRVNLTQIERQYFHRAMLGYRIGEAFCGQGVAKLAVAKVLEIAFGELKLWRVEATVREGNQGSTRILQHNGFREFGRATCAIKFHGEWSDLTYFERNAASGHAASGHAASV